MPRIITIDINIIITFQGYASYISGIKVLVHINKEGLHLKPLKVQKAKGYTFCFKCLSTTTTCKSIIIAPKLKGQKKGHKILNSIHSI